MVEVQCAWLRPIRACNQPGCQRKQTGREPHGWLIHMHATRPGWPACRDPRPRGAPAGPALLGTPSNEPGANEHIYLHEREAWHGAWKEAAGRTEPAWKPASSTPNPLRGRQGVSLLRASVFLGYEKRGKGDRGTGQVELHAASFIPVRKGALRTGPGDALRSRDSLCGRLVTWRADSSLRGRQGGEVRCVPVWPLPLRERRGPGHSA